MEFILFQIDIITKICENILDLTSFRFVCKFFNKIYESLWIEKMIILVPNLDNKLYTQKLYNSLIRIIKLNSDYCIHIRYSNFDTPIMKLFNFMPDDLQSPDRIKELNFIFNFYNPAFIIDKFEFKEFIFNFYNPDIILNKCFLIIIDNKFEIIPHSINITILTELYIPNCDLKIISPLIANLKNLETINLQNNKLECLPLEFFSLSKLKHLDISMNLLTTISKEFASLGELEQIDISRNLLTSISIEFFSLSKLKELYISRNLLTDIPIEIKLLKCLEIVDFSYNKLYFGPEQLFQISELFQSKNLIEIDLSNNNNSTGQVFSLSKNLQLFL